MQSEGSEWRRLHFNSGGIRGKKEGGFTKRTGFFASARPQLGLNPSCQPCAALRTRARRARDVGGSGLKWTGGTLRTPPSAASPCSAGALPLQPRRAIRPNSWGNGPQAEQSKKTFPKMPQKVASGKSHQCVPVLLSTIALGGSLPAVSLLFSLMCCNLAWLLPGDPAPFLVSSAHSLVTLVLLWGPLLLSLCLLLFP